MQFQNIHTFTYKKTLHSALLLFFSKIVENRQYVLQNTNFIKSFANPFVDNGLTSSDLTFFWLNSLKFWKSTCFVLFEVTFLFKLLSSSSNFFFLMKLAISLLLAKFACSNLIVKFFDVNLINSWVVIFLSWSWSVEILFSVFYFH